MIERTETGAAVDRAAELNERHDRYLWDAVIRYYETPLPLARGRGHVLYDFDGNEYLDFFGGILTVSVGHCHPTVTKAIQEQAETLVHTSTLYPTAPIVELAEKIFSSLSGRAAFLAGAGETSLLTLQHMTAAGIDRVFLTNRTAEKAKEMAERAGLEALVRVVPFEERFEFLAEVVMGVYFSLMNNWVNLADYPLKDRLAQSAALLSEAISPAGARTRGGGQP